MGPWRRGSASVRNGKVAGPNPAGSTRRFLPWRARQGTRADRLSSCIGKSDGRDRQGPDGPVVAQPPRKRQVAGSNPARGSREASAMPAVRRTGRPGARHHGRLPLRRWCNGEHGGLQNRRSGFESRPACDAAILLFGPSGLRLRKRMATVSECGVVGSARGWGPRGRGFESRHSDMRKPNKTELARMRAKYAERRRKRLGGKQRGPRPVP